MSQLYSVSELEQIEPQIKELPQKYSRPASDEAIEKTKAALESRGHKVSVVSTPEEAVNLIKEHIPEGASVYNAGSTTLREIGFLDVLKTTNKWRNLHAEFLAETDPVKSAEKRREGMSADYFLSSVSAISEEGDLVVVDASGTRVGGFAYSAKNVVVVAGSNKIVPTYEDAVARTYDFALPLESARARKAYGVPGSAVNYFFALRNAGPWATRGRVHVVLLKNSYGY
jgi:L-lactate utilization protein LutB